MVNKRLALARVSPVLLDKYRAEEMNLELLQAFTLTDDHETQEELWEGLQPWDRNPQTIRRLLSQNDIPGGDKRVRFVGLDRYEAEGGPVKRDLFHDRERGAYVTDAAKLTRLVNEKLDAIATKVKADGWKWVQVQPEVDYQFLGRHKRIHARELPLSPEAEAEREALEREQETLQEQISEEDDDDRSDTNGQVYERLDEIQDRLFALRSNRDYDYTELVKAACGVVVGIGNDGQPAFTYGLLRREDEATLANNTAEAKDPTEGTAPAEVVYPETKTETASPYSAALVETLTAEKTAALAAELARQPRVALSAVVHALILSEFALDFSFYGARSSLQIAPSHPNLEQAKQSPAFQTLDAQRREWFSRFPKDPDDVWQWCLEQDLNTLLALLAYCAARTVNAVKSKTDTGGLSHSSALGTALHLDMTRWFQPTAEKFFDRISKARIAEAMTEAGKPPDATKLAMKKAQFAKVAEFEIAGTGWLPQLLRISSGLAEETGSTVNSAVKEDSVGADKEEEEAR